MLLGLMKEICISRLNGAAYISSKEEYFNTPLGKIDKTNESIESWVSKTIDDMDGWIKKLAKR